MEEAAHLSKAFTADFTIVTQAMAAVNNSWLRPMNMKKTIGRGYNISCSRTNSFNEIPIDRSAEP